MKRFSWIEEKHCLGIPSIDRQHRRLTTMISLAHELATRGTAETNLDILLENIVQYIDEHFFYEEYLMSHYGFAEFESHRQSHSSILERILQTFHRYRATDEDRGPMAMLMSNLLIDWLDDHMASEDSALCQFLRPHVDHIEADDSRSRQSF